MKRISNYIWVILFSFIFFAVGAGMSIYGWNILQNARVSKSWPTAEGRIVQSTVRESVNEEEDNTTTTYFADVRFRYVIDAQQYSSDTVSFGQYGSSSQRRARKIVDKYPRGTAVLVYYDPEDIHTAVLEPGITGGSIFFLAIGLLFSFIGLVFFPLFLFRRRA